MDFEIISEITSVEIIATGTGIVIVRVYVKCMAEAGGANSKALRRCV